MWPILKCKIYSPFPDRHIEKSSKWYWLGYPHPPKKLKLSYKKPWFKVISINFLWFTNSLKNSTNLAYDYTFLLQRILFWNLTYMFLVLLMSLPTSINTKVHYKLKGCLCNLYIFTAFHNWNVLELEIPHLQIFYLLEM